MTKTSETGAEPANVFEDRQSRGNGGSSGSTMMADANWRFSRPRRAPDRTSRNARQTRSGINIASSGNRVRLKGAGGTHHEPRPPWPGEVLQWFTHTPEFSATQQQ
jgi:hypothetical protein